MTKSPPILLLAGPTASGKSALALERAVAEGGEIVNADAIQLYRDLDLLSARPSADEMAMAPHHLFGVVDAADGWSVGRWLRAALEVIGDIRARGRSAIVVGGTGLYFNALTKGLAEIPPTPAEVREAARALYDAEGEGALRDRLRAVDPVAEARINPADRQRLLRAWEVWRATGRALTEWQTDTRPALPPGDWRGLILDPDREVVYARCDARLDAMVAGGALDEVAALMARGLDPGLPAMKAVGLRELASHLSGQRSLDEALALAKQETRRYAKRQLTWWRNQLGDWQRLSLHRAAGEGDPEGVEGARAVQDDG